jgi:hypothetical protein
MSETESSLYKRNGRRAGVRKRPLASKVWALLSFGVGAAIAGGMKECERQEKAPAPTPQIIVNIHVAGSAIDSPKR